MEKMFEELDYRATPLGELSLRRRKVPMLDNRIVYEVILNDEFLMSSLFHAAEDALAELGLAACPAGPLDVVVGGLGLGYTAKTALQLADVKQLRVVEFLEPVIDWHRKGLVPLGTELTADPRLEFVHNDFFTWIAGPQGAQQSDQRYHAILLDIDHTPDHWLHDRHASFYSTKGLTRLKERLLPGGVFALWADLHPNPQFCERLNEVFPEVHAHEIPFDNPLTGGTACGTVYVARSP